MSEFLKQLQESAGLLNNKIKDTDTTQIKNLFGNYDPRSAADYTIGPMGGIAQNRFEGNQFQMPNLFNAQYIPEAFNQGSLLQTPTYNNMGTFTPGAFNQYGNIPVTGNIPSNVSTTTTSDRGGNNPNQNSFSGQFERFLDKNYKINEDGTVEPVTGTMNTFMNAFSSLQNLTPSGILGGLIGDRDLEALNRLNPQQRQSLLDETGFTLSSLGIKETPTGDLISSSDYNPNNPFSTKAVIPSQFANLGFDPIGVQSSGYNVAGLANVQSQKQKLAADMAKRQKDRDKEGGQGGGGEQGNAGSAGDRDTSSAGGFGGFGGGADQ